MKTIGITALQSKVAGAIILIILGIPILFLLFLRLADAIYKELNKWKDRTEVFQRLRFIKNKLLRIDRHHSRQLKWYPKSQRPLKSVFLTIFFSIASMIFFIYYVVISLGMTLNSGKLTFSLFCYGLVIAFMLIRFARGCAMAAHRHYLSLKP